MHAAADIKHNPGNPSNPGNPGNPKHHMTPMTPQTFIAKWGPGGPAHQLNEEQGAHLGVICSSKTPYFFVGLQLGSWRITH